MVQRGQAAWLRRWAVSLAVGFVALRLLGPAWPSHFTFDFPDSTSYFDVARRSPFSFRFWFDKRPPTYPLLIWLTGRSHLGIVVVQTVLSFAAWIWLVRLVARSTHRKWLSYPAAVMLIVVALQARWIFWDTLVLTESLSATLAVAMVAGWLAWWQDPTRSRTILLSAIITAWMCLRDSNATTWLVVALPAAIFVAVLVYRSPTARRRSAAVVLGLSVAVGAYSIVGQLVTDRGETSFHNNVGLRWLPDPTMTEYMVARGMPLDSALINQTGRSAWDDGEAFLVAPDLATYRQWADGIGRPAALSSFVFKAPWYMTLFSEQANSYADPAHLFVYDNYGVANYFPVAGLGPLDPVRSLRSLIVWGILGAGAIALTLVFRRSLGLVLALLWVSVLADSYLSFCADAIEVGRHLVGPWLRFSVVSIVVVAVGVDAWLTARSQRGNVPPPSEAMMADAAGASSDGGVGAEVAR